MKIGILIRQINKAGAERAATRISSILAKNHEVYFIVFAQECPIAYDYSGKLIDLGVRSCDGVFNKLIASVKRTHRLKKLKKKLKLDVVISFLQSPNFVNVKSKVKGCKTIVSIRNFIFTEKSQSLYSRLELATTKTILKRADYVLPVSAEIKDYVSIHFSKIKGINSKLKVLYNPYEINEIIALSNESYDLKKENYDFCFCTVGRLMHQKGFWNLIKSFYLFNQIHNNSKLFIVGKGEDCSKIESLIDKLNLKDKVILLGQMDNPFKVISKCDAYVLSSLFEGFPNALVEAMACGLPVIASNCQSGPKEILDDVSKLDVDGIYKAKYGIIYKNYSSLEEDYSHNITKEHQILADAMELLYNDKNLQEYYKKQSIKRAKEFNYEETEKKLEEILNA